MEKSPTRKPNAMSYRSLNNHVKKEELKRIERENMKIAKKIIEMKPEFTVNDMLNEWH